MIPGVVAANTAFSGAVTPWTPLNMESAPPIYLDASSSVVAEAGGFVSSISNLGSYGSAGDFSQSTEARKPTVLSGELNAEPVIRFDGSDDLLSCGSASALAIFRNVPAAWVFSVYKKRSTDASPTSRYLVFSARQIAAVRFGLLVGTSAASNANKPAFFAQRLDAETAAALRSPNVRVGSYLMLFAHINYSTRAGVIYENGSQSASNAALTTSAGNTSDTSSVATHPLSVGAFPDGSVAADVDLAAVVIGNTNLSASDREKLEGWAAHKWGLTANLPAGHPYKTTAPTI